MDTKRLKAVMTLHGETAGDLAGFLGITRGTLSLKMNEKGAEFTQGEIAKIKAHYGLTAADLENIFFNEIVSA